MPILTDVQRRVVLEAITARLKELPKLQQQIQESVLPESRNAAEYQLQGLAGELAELWVGINIERPPRHTKHAILRRTSDSPYRSQCPECLLGTLMVMRDQQTFELKKEDCCLLCGQQYIYEDIEELRAAEKGE